jgi:rare lipoprotein A (peptidoglycan hydrolase)
MNIRNLFLVGLCLALAGCTQHHIPEVTYSSKPYTVKNSFGKHTYRPDKTYRINPRYQSGQASYYGGEFNGRKTASSVIFDEKQLVVAHPTAVIPSVAKITRLDNKKSIYVIIVDRGPFAKKRICDLSVAAARALGSEKAGRAAIKIEILPVQSKILAKKWKHFKHKRLPDKLFTKISNPSTLSNYLKQIR